MAVGKKKFPLEIVVNGTNRVTRPMREATREIDRLARRSHGLTMRVRALGNDPGLQRLARGFRRARSAAFGLAKGIGVAAAAAGVGLYGLKGAVDELDKAAKVSARVGLSVDTYNQLQYAAKISGTEVARFDAALEGFSKRLGEAKAGTGSLTTFLQKASPELLKQVKAAKSNEEAFDLMVRAMGKLDDPSKKAALAAAAFGRSGQSLINMFNEGPEGIKKLRDESARLTGPLGDSAKSAEGVNDSMTRVSESMKGIKAALIAGLGPVLIDLFGQLSEWLAKNRDSVRAWAIEFGKKLPGILKEVGKFLVFLGKILAFMAKIIGAVTEAVLWLVDALGGWDNILFIIQAPMKVVIGYWKAMIWVVKKLGEGFAAMGRGILWVVRQVVDGVKWFAGKVKWYFMNLTPVGWAIQIFGPLKDVFQGIWDGIVGVFEWAKETIGETIDWIWDKITAVTGAIEDAASAVEDFFTSDTGNNYIAPRLNPETGKVEFPLTEKERAQKTLEGYAEQGRAAIRVIFGNAPPGTRVQTDAHGFADVKTIVGYSLGGEQ